MAPETLFNYLGAYIRVCDFNPKPETLDGGFAAVG